MPPKRQAFYFPTLTQSKQKIVTLLIVTNPTFIYLIVVKHTKIQNYVVKTGEEIRIKHFAIILLCILFASCSAEIVKQMPKEELKEENTKAIAIATGASLEIKFKPVAFAKSYAYSISSLNNGEIQEGTTPSYDGMYYIFKADITDIAEGDVIVYASASEKNQNWTKIATANFVTTLKGAPIDAYISRRDENTAEIRINTTLSPENIE